MDLSSHELRGRLVAQMFFSELEKIAQSIAGGPMEGAEAGQMEGGIKQQPDEKETSPAHGVVAARVEQLSNKRAMGIPVMQPPPGYVYAPELTAFVPNEQDPGWIAAEQAAEAAKAKSFYDKGQEDMQVGQAQQAMDQMAGQQAEQQAQEGMQQQQMQEQQAVMQQQVQQKAMEQTATDAAKQQAESLVPGMQSPEGVTGQKPKPKKKRKPKPKEAQGVTIKIGK